MQYAWSRGGLKMKILRMSRREFAGWAGCVLVHVVNASRRGAPLLAGVGWPGAARASQSAETLTIELGEHPELSKTGGFKVFNFGPKGTIVFRRGEKSFLALSLRCRHRGCGVDWQAAPGAFVCSCHGSRYDRLGVKVKELGPAPRGMDRFAHRVEDGSLIVDTSKVVLGPLPVALGQPGLIPAKSPTGCI